ncbi:MAG: HAD-IIIC family phosphatase [Lachnospiraceae bacterium]|nr:HAD-IIIC family phosphatase [Lachnospiraceae bacterium]
MYKFKEMIKAAKKEVSGKEVRLAVLGTCATQFLSQCIAGYAHLQGMNLRVFDADYNQIDAQLIDEGSETFSFAPDMILIYLATDKLYEDFLELDKEKRPSFASDTLKRIIRYWDMASKYSNARILQMNFSEIRDAGFGNLGVKVADSFTFQIRKLNVMLAEEMTKRKGVFPIDILSVQIALGNKAFYDPVLYYNAKVNVALNSWGYVAKEIYDVMDALAGHIKKCVVLDLDNTLWGGVIGDDGLAGIEIGELGRGHVFTDLQLYFKQLKDRGILLAVCSKNDEATAKEPFEKHEEMVLRLSDFAMFVANWEDKASNIRHIQQTLNIGMDSLVFIDDNPFERNLVRSMIPDICVPELPEDPAEYLGFLQNENLFEVASYSSEDADRTGMYQAEAKRRESEASFESIDDYLKSLEMIGEARPFEPVRYPRIAQLTQRSNQFNLRTVRYTEDDIARIADDKDRLTLYYTLKDKYGDHGLVSVVIMEKESEETAFIDTWLMSCRVLKRGMEEYIINKAVEAAANAGYTTIHAEYIPTAKNSMVKDIYTRMGFEKTAEDHYEIRTENFKKLNTYINDGGN